MARTLHTPIISDRVNSDLQKAVSACQTRLNRKHRRRYNHARNVVKASRA